MNVVQLLLDQKGLDVNALYVEQQGEEQHVDESSKIGVEEGARQGAQSDKVDEGCCKVIRQPEQTPFSTATACVEAEQPQSDPTTATTPTKPLAKLDNEDEDLDFTARTKKREESKIIIKKQEAEGRLYGRDVSEISFTALALAVKNEEIEIVREILCNSDVAREDPTHPCSPWALAGSIEIVIEENEVVVDNCNVVRELLAMRGFDPTQTERLRQILGTRNNADDEQDGTGEESPTGDTTSRHHRRNYSINERGATASTPKQELELHRVNLDLIQPSTRPPAPAVGHNRSTPMSLRTPNQAKGTAPTPAADHLNSRAAPGAGGVVKPSSNDLEATDRPKQVSFSPRRDWDHKTGKEQNRDCREEGGDHSSSKKTTPPSPHDIMAEVHREIMEDFCSRISKQRASVAVKKAEADLQNATTEVDLREASRTPGGGEAASPSLRKFCPPMMQHVVQSIRSVDGVKSNSDPAVVTGSAKQQHDDRAGLQHQGSANGSGSTTEGAAFCPQMTSLPQHSHLSPALIVAGADKTKELREPSTKSCTNSPSTDHEFSVNTLQNGVQPLLGGDDEDAVVLQQNGKEVEDRSAQPNALTPEQVIIPSTTTLTTSIMMKSSCNNTNTSQGGPTRSRRIVVTLESEELVTTSASENGGKDRVQTSLVLHANSSIHEIAVFLLAVLAHFFRMSFVVDAHQQDRVMSSMMRQHHQEQAATSNDAVPDPKTNEAGAEPSR
ncbi:unnamed protein product [Amoebophrya sp. A25]|nr:unnamed protein product [Amoebophrya sp. A25]|eukprot:GSA25T00015682001.1